MNVYRSRRNRPQGGLQQTAASLHRTVPWAKCIALFAIVAMSAGLAHAQTYPTRPIKLIVPWPAGGGVDTAARMIAEPLAQRLGQPIVVDNRPGAAGNIGTAVAAHEKPDGYTLLMASLSPNSVNPHLYSNLGFEPIKDFAPIALVYTVPSFLVVPATSPANTAQELVALAKASPGKLNFGSGGPGSSQHLFGVMFNTATKIDTVHIAYKGTSPAEQGLDRRAGRLHARSADVPAVRDGRTPQGARRGGADAQPGIAERADARRGGHQGRLHADLLRRRCAGGHAEGDRRKLNAEINAILKTDDMRARLAKLAAEPGTGTPEEFGQFMESELKRYGEIVRISGAKAVE